MDGNKYNYLKIDNKVVYNLEEEINSQVKQKYLRQKNLEKNKNNDILKKNEKIDEKAMKTIISFTFIISIIYITFSIKNERKNKKTHKETNKKNDNKEKSIINIELENKVNEVFSSMNGNELEIIYDYLEEYKKIYEKAKENNIIVKDDNLLYNTFLKSYRIISVSSDLSKKTLDYNYYKNLYFSIFEKMDINLRKQFKRTIDGEKAKNFYNESLDSIFNQDEKYIDYDKLNVLKNNQMIYMDFNVYISDYNKIECILKYIYKILECSNKICILFKIYEIIYNLSDTSEFYSMIKNMLLEVGDIELVIKNTKPVYDKFYKKYFLNISDNNLYKLLIQLLAVKINNTKDNYLNTMSICIEKWIESISINNYSVKDFVRLNLLYIKNNIAKNNFKIFINEVDKIPEYINLYQESIKNRRIIMDRQRYLSGNFEKEKQEKDLKYSFENIKTGYEFEEYLVKLFKAYGYKVEHTGKTGDQGADLVLTYDEIIYAVQTKFYNSKLSNTPIQEIVGALKYYKANKGIVITNNIFTKGAEQLAKANDVILIDGNDLKKIAKNVFKMDKKDIFKCSK